MALVKVRTSVCLAESRIIQGRAGKLVIFWYIDTGNHDCINACFQGDGSVSEQWTSPSGLPSVHE